LRTQSYELLKPFGKQMEKNRSALHSGLRRKMMRSRKIIQIFIVLSLACWLVIQTFAQSVGSPKDSLDWQLLEQIVAEEMASGKVPGAQVAVISGEKVVFQKGFGVANIESEIPVTTKTLFRLGSTTKMFVAAALVVLAEQGKIKFETPIGNYAKNLHPSLAKLTLHQLLSHTAGLKDEAPQIGSPDETAMAKRVQNWDEKMFFIEPDKVMSYSNAGYVLAGYVLEQVGGKPFADMVDDLVLKTLLMKTSTFRPLSAMTYPLAIGHNSSPKGAVVVRPFAEYAGNYPPGSLFSNVEELSNFVVAFLNQGKSEGKQVLSPMLINLISQPHAKILALNREYGYGLVRQIESGVQIVQHTGARSGYGSIIFTAPEHRAAVIILTNRTGAVFSRSARKAIEILVPKKAESIQSTSTEQAMKTDEIANYAGIYVNNETIRAELVVIDGKLLLKAGDKTFSIKKIGENRFSAPGAGQLQNFLLMPDSSGKIEFMAVENWALKKRN